MFQDELILFVSACVGGGLTKIGRDYNYLPIMKKIKNVISLFQFYRRQDIIKNGVIALEKQLVPF